MGPADTTCPVADAFSEGANVRARERNPPSGPHPVPARRSAADPTSDSPGPVTDRCDWPVRGPCGDPWPTPIRIDNQWTRTRAHPRRYPTIRSSGPTPARSPTGGTRYSAGPRPPESPRTYSKVWNPGRQVSSSLRKARSSRVRCALLRPHGSGEVRCASWGRWTGADGPDRGDVRALRIPHRTRCTWLP